MATSIRRIILRPKPVHVPFAGRGTPGSRPHLKVVLRLSCGTTLTQAIGMIPRTDAFSRHWDRISHVNRAEYGMPSRKVFEARSTNSSVSCPDDLRPCDVNGR